MKMKRALLLCILVLAALPARANTLEAVDAAVLELGSFVTRAVPDRNGVTVSLGQFLSDEYGQNLLGDRLKSELELYLAGNFKRTSIVDPPAGNYQIRGELQAYAGRVRIIVKILKPDGVLAGGKRVELELTAEIEELLRPSQTQGRFSDAAPQDDWEFDSFEPDDTPGFEVEVTGKGASSFDRFLIPGDIDRFRFYLEEPALVVLEAVTEVDTQLLLYREGENIPFLVDDNRSGLQSSRLEASLEAGYYIAEVFAYDFDIQGAYTMSINLAAGAKDAYEPDNRLEEARTLDVDSSQERTLLSGDQDWVELGFKLPGFYTLYTSGVQVDTRLILTDEVGNVLLEDDNSGELFNAQAGLFLGTRRIFARVEAAEFSSNGAYTLVLAGLDPPQLYPNGTVTVLRPDARPHYLKLRILQSGNYAVRWKTASGPARIDLFSLPGMRSMRSLDTSGGDGDLYTLKAGDYLVAVAAEEPESIRLCIAAEDSADNCSRRLQD
jgi:hypothetical protein